MIGSIRELQLPGLAGQFAIGYNVAVVHALRYIRHPVARHVQEFRAQDLVGGELGEAYTFRWRDFVAFDSRHKVFPPIGSSGKLRRPWERRTSRMDDFDPECHRVTTPAGLLF